MTREIEVWVEFSVYQDRIEIHDFTAPIPQSSNTARRSPQK